MNARYCIIRLAGLALILMPVMAEAQQLGQAYSQAMGGMEATRQALEALLADPTNAKSAAADANVQAAMVAMQKQITALQSTVKRLQQEAPPVLGAAPPPPDALAVCRAENAKLYTVGHDVLHLYETQDFRSKLLHSYESLLGLARVKLETIIQDYDDRLLDHVVSADQTGASQ